MATLNMRLPENVPGAFYVSSECIDCDQCRETAPAVFRRQEEISFSIVFHQPVTDLERQEAEQALKGCPVDAIGNDGGVPSPNKPTVILD